MRKTNGDRMARTEREKEERRRAGGGGGGGGSERVMKNEGSLERGGRSLS